MRRFYVPKGLHGGMLRELLADLVLTPLEASKFLRVTERSIWRWMADDSAPYAVLVALWHESPRGHYNQETDVGNHNTILRGLASAHEDAHAKETARLARVMKVGDFGSANDPLFTGPVQVERPHAWIPAAAFAQSCLSDPVRVDFL